MIEDFIYVQKTALTKTLSSMKNLPYLSIHLLVYGLIYNMGILVLGSLGFGGGFILALLRAGIFSHLLYTLNGIVNYNRFNWKNLGDGFSRYFYPSITAFFAYYIIELLAALIAPGLNGPAPINQAIDLCIFLLFSAVGEYIYIGGYASYDSISASFNLLKEEPLNWLLVNGLVYVLLSFLGINIDIFRLSFNFSPLGLVEVLLLSFYLIYRGKLFGDLYMSTRRKREYMRR